MKPLKQQIREFRKQSTPEKIEQRKNSPIKYIMEQQKIRVRQDLLRLRVAIDSAESVTNYDRYLLHNVFREAVKDANLHSNWTSRKMKTLEKPFKFCSQSGEENEELTRKFEVQWFYDWINASLDSKLWGFSPIEFGPLHDGVFQPYIVQTTYGKKFYNAVTVIDRDNVKPELGIITENPGDSTGISFDDPKYSKYLMMVCSDFRDTGLLGKAAKYILFKDNALSNWSEWAEVFGMDKRIGYTDSQDDQRTQFIRAMRDMGSNAYGVFTKEDKVEYLGTSRVDAYEVYHQLITYIDGQTSKLVFGQDVVSNETGKLKGTVGENIANMYGDNDARFIAGLVNSRLIPLMQNLGFDFGNCYFKWDSTEKLKLSERAIVDKAISDMGFKHSTEYIDNTYGTQVEEKEEPAPILPMSKKIKALYE